MITISEKRSLGSEKSLFRAVDYLQVEQRAWHRDKAGSDAGYAQDLAEWRGKRNCSICRQLVLHWGRRLEERFASTLIIMTQLAEVA